MSTEEEIRGNWEIGDESDWSGGSGRRLLPMQTARSFKSPSHTYPRISGRGRREQSARMQTLKDHPQLKVQSYKQQIEAAEAQANRFLSKDKKQLCKMNEVKKRAEIAESQVSKLKIKAKAFGKRFVENKRSLLRKGSV